MITCVASFALRTIDIVDRVHGPCTRGRSRATVDMLVWGLLRLIPSRKDLLLDGVRVRFSPLWFN